MENLNLQNPFIFDDVSKGFVLKLNCGTIKAETLSCDQNKLTHSISISDVNGNVFSICIDKYDVQLILIALLRFFTSFPQWNLSASKYEKALLGMGNLLPDDFQMIHYKNEMALGRSEKENMNIVWIPKSQDLALAFVCFGELNYECEDKSEYCFEMSEINDLHLSRYCKYDIYF